MAMFDFDADEARVKQLTDDQRERRECYLA
jgi:hypothetical protein